MLTSSALASEIVTIQDGITTGRILYDGVAAASCLARIAARLCTSNLPAAVPAESGCGTMLKGTLAEGAVCFSDAECFPGLCRAPSCTGQCCQGVCRPASAGGQGAACTTSLDCASDFYCDTSMTSPVCKAPFAAGAACAVWDQCAYGLACAGPDGAMTCRPHPEDGEPCDGSIDCDNSISYCDATEKRCKARLPPGSACSTTAALDSSQSQCEISSVCSNGVCRSFVGPGDACDASPNGSLGRCLGGACENGVCSAAPTVASCWNR